MHSVLSIITNKALIELKVMVLVVVVVVVVVVVRRCENKAPSSLL